MQQWFDVWNAQGAGHTDDCEAVDSSPPLVIDCQDLILAISFDRLASSTSTLLHSSLDLVNTPRTHHCSISFKTTTLSHHVASLQIICHTADDSGIRDSSRTRTPRQGSRRGMDMWPTRSGHIRGVSRSYRLFVSEEHRSEAFARSCLVHQQH